MVRPITCQGFVWKRESFSKRFLVAPFQMLLYNKPSGASGLLICSLTSESGWETSKDVPDTDDYGFDNWRCTMMMMMMMLWCILYVAEAWGLLATSSLHAVKEALPTTEKGQVVSPLSALRRTLILWENSIRVQQRGVFFYNASVCETLSVYSVYLLQLNKRNRDIKWPGCL